MKIQFGNAHIASIDLVWFFSRMLFFCFPFSVFCYLLSFLRQYLGNLAASKFEKKRYCFFFVSLFLFFHCAHLQKFDLFLRLVQQLMMIQAPLISFMIFHDFNFDFLAFQVFNCLFSCIFYTFSVFSVSVTNNTRLFMKSGRGMPLVKTHPHFPIWHGGILLSHPGFRIGFFFKTFKFFNH